MTATNVVRGAFAIFVVLVLQHTVFDSLRVAGAHPELMLLLPIGAGYVGGPMRGAGFGFAAGLVADLFLPTTFGLSALVGCLLGYAVGVVSTSTVRSSWWFFPVLAATATAAGLTGYAILGALLGASKALTVYLPPALVVATPVAAILAIPVMRLVAWAMPARPTAPLGGIR